MCICEYIHVSIPCVCRQPKETRRGLEIRLDSLDGAAGSCETANMGAGNQTGILWNRTELSQTAKLFLRNQCFRRAGSAPAVWLWGSAWGRAVFPLSLSPFSGPTDFYDSLPWGNETFRGQSHNLTVLLRGTVQELHSSSTNTTDACISNQIILHRLNNSENLYWTHFVRKQSLAAGHFKPERVPDTDTASWEKQSALPPSCTEGS